MKTKLKKAVAAMATLGVAALYPAAGLAGPNDRELPDENDIFWQVTSAMDTPADTAACQAKIDTMAADGTLEAYINQHRDELMDEGSPQGGEWQGGGPTAAEMAQGFYQMCAILAQMPTQMQADMALEGVTTSLFDSADWHNVSGLYFQKSGEGRISFTNTLDFLSYRFFRFMSNFDSMVEMNDGYISLNASMVSDIKNYGAQLTMYGLDFSEQPDIYVDGKLAGASDVSDITYNAADGSLTFTAKHFSAYRAVAKGSKIKAMKITKLAKKSVKYNASKSSFKIKVKGRNLKPSSGQTIQCTLGFEQASKVSVSKNGRTVYCTFPMSYFNDKGTFPLAINISGKGEASKTNAFTVK